MPAGGESPTEPPATAPEPRALRDKTHTGVAGLLTDLVATGEPVFVLTAHARHRAHSMQDRLGGFSLTSWAAIEHQPGLAEPFPHVVALDPPAHAHLSGLLEHLPGTGWTHLAWGEAELGFARRIHEWDYALRAPLVAVYRALREAGGATGEACEAMLAGDGAQPRSAALAGRLVRVLAELGLVALDRDGPALTVAEPTERTALERSAAFRAYHRRLQDGLTYLTTPRRAVA